MIRVESKSIDIAIYANDTDSDDDIVVIVECKAPGHVLDSIVLEKAQDYASGKKCNLIFLTNGTDFRAFFYDETSDEDKEMNILPNYLEMREYNRFESDIISDNRQRPPFTEFSDSELIEHYTEDGLIGKDTRKELRPFLVNLLTFFWDDNSLLYPLPLRLGSVDVIKDIGVRWRSFGNASGKDWPGYYRSFLVRDSSQNHQVVSMAVLGQEKITDDPKGDNRRGNTNLIVAVDDYKKSHNALQLRLDSFVDQSGHYFTFWHNGGRNGSEVVERVRKIAPDFYRRNYYGERMVLGTLDNSKLISWEQSETRQLVGNLIEYALLRDEFSETQV
jgi:hypothetical protein